MFFALICSFEIFQNKKLEKLSTYLQNMVTLNIYLVTQHTTM